MHLFVAALWPMAGMVALSRAIDLHCYLQNMDRQPRASVPKRNEMTYYVNRAFAGWVEQHVKRRVYIELKLECIRNRSRDAGKAMDVWLCVYCRGYFPNKLRLTDHRIASCACGLVDSNRSKWNLPVYPNLKTAKQGKDLKKILQRGDGELWHNLHDDAMWLDLNPELRDVIFLPPGARVHEHHFMEYTFESLKACLPPAADCRPHPKPRASFHRRPNTTVPAPTTFVDMHNDDDIEEEHETSPCRTNKRSRAEMEEEYHVYVRNRKKRYPPSVDHEGPPFRPIRITPNETRCPSPDRDVFRPARSPAANILSDVPLPSDIPSDDIVAGLRRDRHAFTMRAANVARASVKMDNPKPTLRPSIQPPGLFHLVPCNLLTFDLERDEFQAFEEQVQKWNNDPAFTDRLFAAYDRFYSPAHQVQVLCLS
jgi:hypothetical protein